MQDASSNGAPKRRNSNSRGPIRALLDLFSSVWFGISLLTMLFFYCSIGSAVPKVRQLPFLEMTEFEWFHWWPFNVLLGVFCLTLTTVTIRRIPLRWVNSGVWMIHTGIITLAIGSYIYFGTKIEGDTPVFRRRVSISLPGMDKPAHLVALPGGSTEVIAGPDLWKFSIQSTNTDWPILSDEHKGESAYAVSVAVTTPTGETFIRQLLDGYEQYTEDIIPGKGRAIKNIGRKLVEEDLKLALEYQPTTTFHVMDTWALFVREEGTTDWIERPIEGLPRYNDRVATRDQVFTAAGYDLPIRSIDLEVAPGDEADALGSSRVRVTGYLRYAHMDQRWRDGGPRLNPVLQFSAQAHGSADQTYELIAFDRARNQLDRGTAEFRWLRDQSEVETLPTSSDATLAIAVPDAEVDMTISITSTTPVGRDHALIPIEGTDFAYRILTIQDGLTLPSASGLVSLVMVEVSTPEGTFKRMVADDPSMTRDMGGDDGDPHGALARDVDPRIVMKYSPATAPVVFAGYPGGLHIVFNGEEGQSFSKQIRVGETVALNDAISIRVDQFLTHAVAEIKPFIVPPESRRANAGASFTMIRLEVAMPNGQTQSKWLRYSQYALPGRQYTYSGRFPDTTEVFHLPDDTHVEVLFSRERRPLPTSIALADFELDTHLGGYTGSSSGIRNYLSMLRFWDDGRWTQPTQISVNSPTGFGGYWYFQSTWDPPSSGMPGSGMNYTGLGVGNRNGVYVQLAGCCIAVTGMLFAFYVKPVLKRRRSARARAKVGKEASEDNVEGAEELTEAAVDA